MVTPAVDGIDLFKIAGRSISGWIPSYKTGTAFSIRQSFCSQLEERLLLWLEYNSQVKNYARGDIGTGFATTYRLPVPKHAPYAIGYEFLGKPHDYLPDMVGTLTNGQLFIAEAGIKDDKRGDRNLVKAEAARRLARIQRGVFWIGTEHMLTRQRHYNLVFLHARRRGFPDFADLAVALQKVWPWGEMTSVEEIESRLVPRFPAKLVEAAIWKMVADGAAAGHLLIDLEQFTLDRRLPLGLLPPDADPIALPSLSDTLLPEPVQKDRVVGINGCEHTWPCYGKPTIIFHDRGKIFTSERARQVLVDRLGIITEQAPPYAPSANHMVVHCGLSLTTNAKRRHRIPSDDGRNPGKWTGRLSAVKEDQHEKSR